MNQIKNETRMYPSTAFAAFNLPQKFFQNQPWWQLRCIPKCDLTVGELISIFLPNIFVAAGVIFFLLILGGGIALITSAGGEGSAQSAAKAKAAVTYGVVGFLLVIGAYFILQIVGVLTGVNFVNPSSLN